MASKLGLGYQLGGPSGGVQQVEFSGQWDHRHLLTICFYYISFVLHSLKALPELQVVHLRVGSSMPDSATEAWDGSRSQLLETDGMVNTYQVEAHGLA